MSDGDDDEEKTDQYTIKPLESILKSQSHSQTAY